MRSLLSGARAEEPGAQPATAPANTAATAPETPRQPGAEGLHAKLYSTTERLAVALVERAEKDLLTPTEDGRGPGVRELQQTVEFAMNLLVKLPKLKPEDAEEDAGVDVLRAAMTDPAKVVDRLQANPKFVEALRAKGWLPPPERPHHRPTKAQAAERAAYQERRSELGEDTPDDDDDSALQGLLAGRTPSGAAPE